MASHAAKVRQDIARWVGAGLIDAATGSRLATEIDATDRRSLSFGSILAALAALLVAAALLLFVASNWEGMPRLARVAALFFVIAGGYVGSAALKNNDHGAIGEALWLVAAAAFGGSIALIGQMYHLTGDETEAILVWCAGTAVAAVALRSAPLTIATVGIGTAWMVLRIVDFWRSTPFPYWFVGIALMAWVISYWTRSAAARHLTLLSLIFFAAALAVDHDVVSVASGMVLVSAAAFAAAVFAPEPTERVAGLGGLLPVHALIAFLIGMAMIQVQIESDAGSGFMAIAAVTFAGIVAALMLYGRESRGLRWIAYAGFALELCLVYAILFGTMRVTAGFFLVAGLLIGGLAFGIIRIEKRMRPQLAATGAAA